MKLSRFRITSAMLIVLVAALDFAMIRASGLAGGGTADNQRWQFMVLFVLPMANLFGIALFLFARGSSPGRRFLGGFATSAALTSILLVAAMAWIDLEILGPPIRRLGQWLSNSVFGRTNMLNKMDMLVLAAIFASICALPQLLLALLSGSLARNFRRSDRCEARSSGSSD